MASSIPAARTWLYNQLVALQATTLTGVLIRNTGQWDGTASMEQIILRIPDSSDRAWRGFNSLEEDYTIPVFVAIRSHGTDLPTVEARFYAVVAIIESVILAGGAAHLGGNVQSVTPAGTAEVESGPVAAGGNTGGPADLLCQGTLQVACHSITTAT